MAKYDTRDKRIKVLGQLFEGLRRNFYEDNLLTSVVTVVEELLAALPTDTFGWDVESILKEALKLHLQVNWDRAKLSAQAAWERCPFDPGMTNVPVNEAIEMIKELPDDELLRFLREDTEDLERTRRRIGELTNPRWVKSQAVDELHTRGLIGDDVGLMYLAVD